MRKIAIKILSCILILTMVLQNNTFSTMAIEVNPSNKMPLLSVVSKRVSNSDLYSTVPEEQKNISENNLIAVQNEILEISLQDEDIVDYIGFYGNNPQPAYSHADSSIEFDAEYTTLAGISDWSNLRIVDNGVVRNTATNYRGSNTSLSITIPTNAGEHRVATIIAGGHPGQGTVSLTAQCGGKSVSIESGGMISDIYEYTPNSSQIIEYSLEYYGNGEDIVISFNLNEDDGIFWAGIAVSAVIIREVENEYIDVPINPIESDVLLVEDRVVSKSSLYGNVPANQKNISESNPVVVEDKVINVNLNSPDIINFLKFTGSNEPYIVEHQEEESIAVEYDCQRTAVINDWTNLNISCDNNTINPYSATNFQGEGSSIVVTVPTKVGEERVLDIFAGGHPNAGTYSIMAECNEQRINVVAGDTIADSFSYTPGSSQIVHYALKYTGNGESIRVTIGCSGTGNVNWAGIGLSAIILRSNTSCLSVNRMEFNKDTADAGYKDIKVQLILKGEVSFSCLKKDGVVLNNENYSFNERENSITVTKEYLSQLSSGEQSFYVSLSDGTELPLIIDIMEAFGQPRPYVLEANTLSDSNLSNWKLWYRDEFDDQLSDWWEPSYLKWWNYSSESNEKYNTIEFSEEAGSNVLKQGTTETMRTDSIVTRRDNFRNPGITLGVRDLIHNYGAKNLTNYQHLPTDDRGATAYGYFEIRAKITGGTTAKTQSGSSAWWFTGFQDASWQTVEVDMVEYGYGVNESNLNAHFASPLHRWRDPFVSANNSTWNSTDKGIGVSKPADDYHIYGFEWTPNGMKGYFDGVLVWSKNVSVNYRMLMWLSLNSHAYDTYITDSKAHYIDYIRIWKTPELSRLEKELVTKNIVQKRAPQGGNIATLAYAGANGIRSSHYQIYDPGYINDGDLNTAYKAMSISDRQLDAFPITPYNNDDYYLYLDWVDYTEEEISNASEERDVILDGIILASEKEIRSRKSISAIELVANKKIITKSIDSGASNNNTATFVYNDRLENANLFPYNVDVEYSENGITGWKTAASNVDVLWDFENGDIATYVINLEEDISSNHWRLHVNTVWNSDLNQEVSIDNGFYISEIRIYDSLQGNINSEVGEYSYNHATFANISVQDANGNEGSIDKNFPLTDIADGVYVNEFRSSGDGVRLASNPNRVDTSILNTTSYPQSIYFSWDTNVNIDSFLVNIGNLASAPTKFKLEIKEENGNWKTVVSAEENWTDDFESKEYNFSRENSREARLVILEANSGPAIEYNGGIEGDRNRVVRIAGGYYSIAEVELNEIIR